MLGPDNVGTSLVPTARAGSRPSLPRRINRGDAGTLAAAGSLPVPAGGLGLNSRFPVRLQSGTGPSSIREGQRATEKSPEAKEFSAIARREKRSMLCEINSHCGTLEMLVALEDTGPATQYELRRRVPSGYCAFAGSLKCLLNLDLIRSERATGFPFRLRYQLTECGRLLATALIDWERLGGDRQCLSRLM